MRFAVLVPMLLASSLLAGCSQQPVVVNPVVITQTVTITKTVTVNGGGAAQSGNAPNIGIGVDSYTGKWTINSADTGLNWNQFNMKSDKNIVFALNTAAHLGSNCPRCTNLPAGNPTSAGYQGDPVTGGDFFSFCGGSTTSGIAQTSTTIQLVHIPSNSQVFSYTFSSIAACS